MTQRRSLIVEPGPHHSQVIQTTGPEDADSLFAHLSTPLGKEYLSQWIYVPMRAARIIEGLSEKGFVFHHATGTTAVLTKWLGKGDSKIPDFATHRVGVAGFAVNKEGKVLLVKEKRGKFFKLPGGHADLGEDLFDTAVREVREETGVECVFRSLLAVRQSHGLSHGRSDLYFICLLEPLGEQLNLCTDEIADAGWFDPAKLSESSSDLNKLVAELFIAGKFLPLTTVRPEHLITKKKTAFFYADATIAKAGLGCADA